MEDRREGAERDAEQGAAGRSGEHAENEGHSGVGERVIEDARAEPAQSADPARAHREDAAGRRRRYAAADAMGGFSVESSQPSAVVFSRAIA